MLGHHFMISKFFALILGVITAVIYYVCSIIFLPPYYIIKYSINKIKNKNYKYSYLTGGFKRVYCKNRKDIETLFIVYRIPDNDFRSTLLRLIKGKYYFVINMNYDQYCSIDYKVLSSLTATVDNYKTLVFNIPNNLYKI